MKLHPICDVIPEMQPDEFDALVSSIKRFGYDASQPVITYEGLILDGRHRFRACEQLGVECPTREFKGDLDDAVRFVERHNLHRRNLTASQRAAVAAALEPFYAEVAQKRMKLGKPDPGASLPQGRALESAAKAAGTSRRAAQDFKRVASEAPELAEKVRKGEVTINAAVKQIKRTPPPPAVEAIRDGLDLAVTDPKAVEAFARVDDFSKAANAVHAVRRSLEQIAQDKAGRELAKRLQKVQADCRNLASMIRFCAPYTECPMGDNCGRNCKLCEGQRWITKDQYEACEPSIRKRHEKKK